MNEFLGNWLSNLYLLLAQNTLWLLGSLLVQVFEEAARMIHMILIALQIDDILICKETVQAQTTIKVESLFEKDRTKRHLANLLSDPSILTTFALKLSKNDKSDAKFRKIDA